LAKSIFGIGSYSAVPTCSQHQEETKSIKDVACNYLVEAHKLTGDSIGSYVVTAYDLCWDAIKFHSSYSQFTNTFQGCIQNCNKKGKFLASNRLYKGCDEVGNLFLDLYDNCILNHHNYRSVFERGKIHFDRGNLEACLVDMTDLINAGLADDLIKDVKPVDLLITKAQALLEVGQYEKAIEALSDAIKKDPKNKEAYFHRAAAYFESGNLEQALQDYLLSDKGKNLPKASFKPTQEFKNALLNSVCQGAQEAALDFVPSLCHSAYGLGEALWAVAPLNPQALENVNQFASSCYEMAECVVDYCKNVNADTLDGYVDQIKTLYERFDQLNDSEKGELIGYTVGKYGVDLFAGGAVVKSISTYRKLCTANKLCNLESMAVSNANKEAIVASSLKHASERESFFKSVKYNYDAHNKHILGHNDFIKTGSEWQHKNPEDLLNRFAGKGRAERGIPGMHGYKETVDFGEYIGIWKNKEGTIELPTTRGTIHYGKKGAHIVPSNPKPTTINVK
jgi:tetratricopeptide (TPR) repeat protein